MLNFERRKRGKDVDSKVGSVEWKNVTGASAHGRVHEESDWRVERIERGGWVEGVSMSWVRAMSRGARSMPAMPAAETATAREVNGEGEARMSSPPA